MDEYVTYVAEQWMLWRAMDAVIGDELSKRDRSTLDAHLQAFRGQLTTALRLIEEAQTRKVEPRSPETLARRRRALEDALAILGEKVSKLDAGVAREAWAGGQFAEAMLELDREWMRVVEEDAKGRHVEAHRIADEHFRKLDARSPLWRSDDLVVACAGGMRRCPRCGVLNG